MKTFPNKKIWFMVDSSNIGCSNIGQYNIFLWSDKIKGKGEKELIQNTVAKHTVRHVLSHVVISIDRSKAVTE